MSIATSTSAETSRYVDYREFIDYQLRKTRDGIKTTDLLTAAIGAASGVLAYLLAFALFDHWVIEGGFGFGARVTLLLLLLLGLSAWCVVMLVLPAFRRVTPLYAAKEIEDVDPELKNALLTLVDLQQAGRPVPPEVLSVLEKRAGLRMSQMDIEQAVDRRLLMNLSYVLLALVAAVCLYTVFSPKKLSNSLWRALLPVADVAVATRTRIDRIDPGDVEVLARSQLEVVVELSGQIPESATLLYTTADRRFVDEQVVLHASESGLNEFRGVISGENGRGILQNLTYRIVASDARSRAYQVIVKQPPSAVVQEVEYAYPSYMGLSPRVQPGGAIDAWEGTTVTFRATANMPVESALVMFSDSDDLTQRAEETPMQVENGTTLSAQWQLRIRTDGTYPAYYRIQCRNAARETDPEPTLYPIKIRPDQPPQIELLKPVGDIERPANAIVPLLFAARDPDFLLRSVVLRLEKGGHPLPQAPRLYEGPPLRQAVTDTYHLELEPLALQPGDRLTYWLEARDNMEPFADRSGNRANTPRLNIDITAPAPTEEVKQQLADDQQDIQQQIEQARQTAEAAGEEPPPPSDGQTPPPPTAGQSPPPPGPQPSPPPLTSDPPPTEPGPDTPPPGETPTAGSETRGTPGQPQGQQPAPGTRPSDAGTPPQPGTPPSSPPGGDEPPPFEDLLHQLMQRSENQRGQGSADSPSGAEAPRAADQPPSGPPPAGAPPEGSQPPADQRGPEKSAPQPSQAETPTPDAQGPSSPTAPKGQTSDAPSGESPAADSPPAGTPRSAEGPQGEPGGSGTQPSEGPTPAQPPTDGTGQTVAPSDPMGSRSQGDRPPNGETPGQPASESPGTESRPAPGTPAADQRSDDAARTRPDGQSPPTPGTQPSSSPSPSQQPPSGNPPPSGAAPPGATPPADAIPGQAPPAGSSSSPSSPSAAPPSSSSPQESSSSPAPDGPPGPAGGPQTQPESSPTKGAPPPSASPTPGTPPAKVDSEEAPREGAPPDGPSTPELNDGTPSEPSGPQSRPSGPQPPAGTPTEGPVEPLPGPESAAEGLGSPPPSPPPGSPPHGTPSPEQTRDGAPSRPESSPPGTEPEGSQTEPRPTESASPEGPGDPARPQSSGPDSKQTPGGPAGESSAPSDSQGGGTPDGAAGESSESGASGAGGQPGAQPAPSGQGKGNQPGPGQPTDVQGGSGGGSISDGGRLSDVPPGGQQGEGVAPGPLPGPAGPEGGRDAVAPLEAPDLAARKKAANLVLQRLQDQLQRGQVDSQLQQELGVTEEQLREFTRQLEQRLSDLGEDTSPEAMARRRQFEETLRNFDSTSTGTTREGGEGPREASAGFAGPQRQAPPAHRDATRAYREKLSRRQPQGSR